VTRYWCELAWLGAKRVEPGVVIEIEGERVGSLATGASIPPAGATLLHGLTIPGLANAHSHAFQRALRGRTQAGAGSFRTWRERMYRAAAAIDPERYLALARATFAEMALAGITVVGEFHYLHHGPDGTPYDDPNAMGRAIIEAAGDAGVRITLLDACYLHGGIGVAPDRVQRRFSDGDAAAWAERVAALADGPAVRIGAAIHSVRAVDPEAAAAVASWAEERSRPLHAHVSEQPAENQACAEAYGRTPTALLAQAGALTKRFSAVHATHVTAGDRDLLGGARCCVCLCPTTERDLGDGIGPARPLADAGARLSLGTDSNAIIDMFEEARAVELDERLATGVRGLHSGVELLCAATEAGYGSLGWPDGGRIASGSLADFVTLRLDGVRLAGTAPEHAIDAIVFAAAAADVRDVVTGGRFVVRDGVHVRLDVAAELQTALAAVGA
jgi:formiminoglutamate deiminase